MADTFKHIFSFYGFEFDSASVLNMDGLHDLVIIVENKEKSSIGAILIWMKNPHLMIRDFY